MSIDRGAGPSGGTLAAPAMQAESVRQPMIRQTYYDVAAGRGTACSVAFDSVGAPRLRPSAGRLPQISMAGFEPESGRTTIGQRNLHIGAEGAALNVGVLRPGRQK